MAPGTPSMVDFYRYIAPKLKRTVVFNGDTDPCVSYEGTRTALESITSPTAHRGLGNADFIELPGGSYRPWFYNTTVATDSFMHEKPLLFGPALSFADAGVLFGGHCVDYSHNLSFITVHGSGHMVPQFRPQAALHMLSTVLKGGSFAPQLVPDAQLAAMTDSAFESYLDKWTTSAFAAGA
jgi:serine carboxypeptidase-like clade 1|eukprot:COSAG06_NODE_986_length_11190_cov_169.721431_2_plen_181_part_00